MSRIELEQISENEIEVVIPPDTPMEMVQQLTKGFAVRGLIEDLQKSTLSVRYFYRVEDKANDIADKLIKSLSVLAKGADELPYWHPKSQFANQTRVRDMEVGERRAKLGIKQPTNVSTAPEPLTMPATPGVQAGVPKPPTMNTTAPKMYDSDSFNQTTAGGTGKRYAFVNDPASKSEHVEGCQCDKCLEMEKSGYGPKKGGQYSTADNARRKANNVGDVAGVGPNQNVKAFSTKPGQQSMKQQANLTSRIQNMANKKQPVKHFSPEEIAAENVARGLKKSWGQHLPFPNAGEEMQRLAKYELEDGETTSANQLASLMAGKNMLGSPPAQPTNEQLFGGGVVTEEMAKAAEHKYQNTFQSFITEAQKPISQRFNSEAEEIAYWSNIKVAGGDKDDGKSGY